MVLPLLLGTIANPKSIVAWWQRYETEVWVDSLIGGTTGGRRHSELVGEWTQTPPTRLVQPGLCLGRAFFVSILGIGAIEQVQFIGASGFGRRPFLSVYQLASLHQQQWRGGDSFIIRGECPLDLETTSAHRAPVQFAALGLSYETRPAGAQAGSPSADRCSLR